MEAGGSYYLNVLLGDTEGGILRRSAAAGNRNAWLGRDFIELTHN
jgi:hypothetical protein